MNPSSFKSVVATEGLDLSLVGEEVCAMADFADCLLLLSVGVKAATAGLSLDFTLLGVTGSNVVVMVTGMPEVDKDEVAVVLLSTLTMFVGTVTVGFDQQYQQSPNGFYLQGEPTRTRFIRSNDSLASLVPLIIG